jgi:hypothetical protein
MYSYGRNVWSLPYVHSEAVALGNSVLNTTLVWDLKPSDVVNLLTVRRNMLPASSGWTNS